MKHRIYIKDWLQVKPYEKQAPTDFYYLGICNKVLEAIEDLLNKSDDIIMEPEVRRNFCCFLSSYLEDQVSKTAIWSSFTAEHQKRYGKPLPFYDCKEYFPDEINLQDVQFLVWYYLCELSGGEFAIPSKPFWGVWQLPCSTCLMKLMTSHQKTHELKLP